MKKSSLLFIIMIFYCFILSGCDSVENISLNPKNADSTNANQNQDLSAQTPENVLPDQIYFMHKDNCSSIQAFKFEGGTLVDVDENGYFMYDNQKYRAYYGENGRLTWDQTYNSGLPMCIFSYEGTVIPVELYNGDERLGIYEQNGKRYFMYKLPNSDMFEGYEITSSTDERNVTFSKAGYVVEDGVIVADVKEYEEVKFEIAKQLEQIYFDGIKVTDLSLSRLRGKYSNARIVEDLSELNLDNLLLSRVQDAHFVYMEDAVDCSTFYVILSEDEKHVEILEITGADYGVCENKLVEEKREKLIVSQVEIAYYYVDIIEATYDEYFDYYGGKEEAEAYYYAFLEDNYSTDEIKEADEWFYNSYVKHVIYGETFHISTIANSYQLKYVYVQPNGSTSEYRTVDIVLDGSKDSLIQILNSWLEPTEVEMDGKCYHYEISLDRETLINQDGTTDINIEYVDPFRQFAIYYIGYQFDYEWRPE